MSLPVVDDVVLGVVLKEVVVLVDVLEALTGLAVVAPQPTAAIESRKAMKKTEADIMVAAWLVVIAAGYDILRLLLSVLIIEVFVSAMSVAR